MLYIVTQAPKGHGKHFRSTTVRVVEAATKKAAIAAVLEDAASDFSEKESVLYYYCKVQAEPLVLGTTYHY